MSEFQYVEFRAIDAPVSEKNLKYMKSQSSRARITPSSFQNEYNFGDFHGNVEEMLRRGYDLHLHYANFGTRKLCIRLPHGFPDPKAAKAYLLKEGLKFKQVKPGSGGILELDPYYESGELDELWDLDALVDRLIPLRAEILNGDMRPLYLAHLAVSLDENHDPTETMEVPVPAGLDKLSAAQLALSEYYCLDASLLAAAAQSCSPPPAEIDCQTAYLTWIREQSETKKNQWIANLMKNPQSPVRMELLAQFRQQNSSSAWPVVPGKRTIAQLQAIAANLANQAKQKSAAKKQRQDAKELAAMAKDPDRYFRQAEQLIAERNSHAYQQVGKILANVRTALANTKRAGLAEQHALKFKAANPNLRVLAAELKRAGFFAK